MGWNRQRWRRFETSMRAWARDEIVGVDGLTEDEWKSLVAIKLVDARFSPFELTGIIDLAVLVAKGLSSVELTGRAAPFVQEEGKSHDRPAHG